MIEIVAVLDQLAVDCIVTCRTCPSDPCFDHECCDAKWRCRQL